MCGSSKPDYEAPVVPPVLPEAPDASRQTTVSKNPDEERRRKLAAGQAGTILTGARGLADTGTSQGKTLLGA